MVLISINYTEFSLEASGQRDLLSTSEFFTSYFSVLTLVYVHFSENPHCFWPFAFMIYVATLKVSENPVIR